MCYSLFFLSIFSPERLLTYWKHTLLVASNCSQVLLRLPLLASFPRLSLSVAQQMHTHTRSHMHTLSHSQQCMHTRSSHNAEPDRGFLQVNRCVLLTCISVVWKWCILGFLFPADCIWRCGFIKRCELSDCLFCSCFFSSFFSALIIALLCVWHVGIFLFSLFHQERGSRSFCCC